MKYKKIIVIFLLIIILLLQFCTKSFSNIVQANDTINKKETKDKKSTSMYMWGVKDIDYSAYSDIIEYLNINTIYVGREYIGEPRDLNSYEYELLFAFAKDKNLNIYIVYDEKSMDQDANLVKIKQLIDEVHEYNQHSEYKLSGLAIDSEFQTLKEYDENLSYEEKKEVFKNYVSAMKEAYKYAKERDLNYVACIPIDYDWLDKNQLEELIKDGCDYVQLMNYDKTWMIDDMQDEMELAKKYHKPIESIAELQKPGPNSVTDAITFYNDGLKACMEKFKEIDNAYQYNLLTFSFHFFNPVLELAQDVLNLKNKFDYELYPKDIEKKSINIEKAYLVNETEKIQGIKVFNKKSNQYIIYFYGVEYGKEYDLIIENQQYEIKENKLVVYEKDDERIKYDEVYCTLKTTEDNPETDKPETDKPGIDNPETDKPETDKTETDKPGIDNPETDKPETDKTETDKPGIDNPETDKPETDKTETDKPRIDNPETDKPGIDIPEIDKPEIDKLETDKPGINNPEIDKSETDKSKTDKPGIDNPETDKSETDKLETDKSGIDKPETDKPETDKSGIDNLGTDNQDSSTATVPLPKTGENNNIGIIFIGGIAFVVAVYNLIRIKQINKEQKKRDVNI